MAELLRVQIGLEEQNVAPKLELVKIAEKKMKHYTYLKADN